MCVKKFGNIDKETQLDVFDRVGLTLSEFALFSMDESMIPKLFNDFETYF